jgi:hypothetical protein
MSTKYFTFFVKLLKLTDSPVSFPRRRESRLLSRFWIPVTRFREHKFHGNDRLLYVLIKEALTSQFGSRAVSLSKLFLFSECYVTQTDRFVLSSSTGRLTVLRKQGSRGIADLVDSRFRGNDKLGYVVVIEQLIVSFSLKTVSLSMLYKIW